MSFCLTCGDEADEWECADCYIARTEIEALKATANTALIVAAVALLVIALLIGVNL